MADRYNDMQMPDAASERAPLRPRFMLDRDQIFYSPAFRRLAGKTQLMAAGQSDVLRTRLTHTLEVSQIARTIGEALGLDLDLIEAIVLGHDLGHTPFGHVGERTLHELMTPDPEHPLGNGCPLCRKAEDTPDWMLPFLGFKHNLQGLVVAMELEKNAAGRGLNLTEYTLYGIQGHTKPQYKPKRMRNHDMLGYYDAFLEKGCKLDGQWAWSLEAMLAGQADEIAQLHHDLEDGLFSGLADPADLARLLEGLLACCPRDLSAEERYVLDHPAACDRERFTYLFTRIVMDVLLNKQVEIAAEQIRLLGGTRSVPVAARNRGVNTKMASLPREGSPNAGIFTFGDEKSGFGAAVNALSKHIGSILGNPQIRDADAEGGRVIQQLFRACYADPCWLPDEWIFAFFGACAGQPDCRSHRQAMTEEKLREQAYEQGMDSVRGIFRDLFRNRNQVTEREELVLMRTICNYIATMTDTEARRALTRIRG